MTLHLLKLAVGAASVDELRAYMEAPGRSSPARITTRMAPKRVAEVLDGGSLYWVVKGALGARQRILGIEPFSDATGISRVHILLRRDVVPVRPRPCRPFQGWRYLRADEAPADLDRAAVDETIPPAMRRDLVELCLI